MKQLDFADAQRKRLIFHNLPKERKEWLRQFKGKARKRAKLYLLQNGRCYYCDEAVATPEHGSIDHVIPKKRGGKNKKENYVFSCKPCNLKKGSFTSLAEVQKYCDELMAFWEVVESKISIIRDFQK